MLHTEPENRAPLLVLQAGQLTGYVTLKMSLGFNFFSCKIQWKITNVPYDCLLMGELRSRTKHHTENTDIINLVNNQHVNM